MERLDDDRPLARVTYLPGVTPVEGALGSSSGRSDLPAVLDATDFDTTHLEPTHHEPAHHEPTHHESGAASASDIELEPLVVPALSAARHVSITALARRGLSRRELERHLRDREFEQHEIDAELARLEEVGFIDDVALAQNLVGTLQERKGLGRSGIAAELTRRLLSPAAIEYALELIDSGDELSRARELAVKWVRQHGDVDRETATRRLSGYLARRGYGGSTVRAAIEQALPMSARRGVAFS
jgi:regulatory protein